MIKSKNFKKRKKSKIHISFYFIFFPKIIKLFILVVLPCFYFINNKNGKEVFYTNIKYNNNIQYNKTIHLSLNIDNKYIYPFIVYLTSLLDNKVNSNFYTIHLLTGGGLSKESMEKIDKIIKKFGNNSVKLIYYNLEGYFKNATKGYISEATYYKIVLPSLLPNVDKIIFTDGDVINLEDLSEMYSIEFKENMYFCGVPDYSYHFSELEDFGISSDKYINIGVLFMNLKALRENSIEKKLTEFVETHPLQFYDQTAINCVCYNNTQVLPYKYNIFAFSFDRLIQLNNEQDIKYRVNDSELNEAFNKPTFFHFVDLDKPWLKSTIKFNRVYWWYYAKMSGFYQEILDYYEFNKDDIEALLKQIPEDGGLLKRNYKKLN